MSNDRLDLILAKLGRIEGLLHGVRKIQDEHHTALFGNNDNEPGLKLKVDRLEQQRNLSVKAIWLAGTGLVAAAGKWIVSWFGVGQH